MVRDMPRHCSICDHEKVEEIDKQLLNGETFQTISNNFDVSAQALQRHKASDHILDLLTKSADAKEATRADNVFAEYRKAEERIENLSKKTYDLLKKAESAKNHSACIGYIREARAQEGELREQRKLLAELEGRLQTQAQINVNTQINILQSAEWIKLRSQILQAIEPYPEAKRALISSLP